MDTIKSFERFGDPWESKYGTMFPFAVTLESGEQVFANGTSESPWWATVGSIVEVTVKGETKKGNKKVSFGKPEGVQQPSRSAPPATRGTSGNRDEAISLAMIFKIAAERGGTPNESLDLARDLWDSFQEFIESPTSDISSSEEEAF
tara:strand:- start:2800 stop:3240 length:441 start_codon:yes stop_codon:yes gene_type:complete